MVASQLKRYSDHGRGKDCRRDVSRKLMNMLLLKIRVASDHGSQYRRDDHSGYVHPRQGFVQGRCAEFIAPDHRWRRQQGKQSGHGIGGDRPGDKPLMIGAIPAVAIDDLLTGVRRRHHQSESDKSAELMGDKHSPSETQFTCPRLGRQWRSQSSGAKKSILAPQAFFHEAYIGGQEPASHWSGERIRKREIPVIGYLIQDQLGLEIDLGSEHLTWL